MKKSILLIIISLLAFAGAKSQYSKRVVFFTDKNGTPYTLNNPSAYLSQRAIDRKNRHSIAIDSTDIPVLARYIDSVRLAGAVTILGRSKWLNAVIIQTTDAAALTKINSFSFVKKTDSVALRKIQPDVPHYDKFAPLPAAPADIIQRPAQINADTFNYGASSNQVKIHKGEFLHNIGARGQTMVMAFLDAGFTGFQTNRFFDSARARNQFLGTWDFVQNNSNVNEDHPHGLNCFSTVASYLPGTFIGTCPEAKYFLLRTEDAPTEQIIEEYNWCLGAEYADSAGVDVISSSLGYTTFDNAVYNHTYADMNGNTTVISRMADLAAKKGILVVNSAGNDGAGSWHYIGAPADGDSVLSIGAVNNSGIIAGFSSFGPTSDGQIKPDVVSVGQGTTISTTGGNTSTGSGTSFSCPNMAGLVTCLWQLFPDYNNWKMITTLRKASDRFTAPHEQYGYGLPNMKKAVGFLLQDFSTMNATLTNFTTTVNFTSKDISSMRYEIERKLPNESSFTKIHTIQSNGAVFASRSYTQNDEITSSPAGVVTYRIRQVIDTAAATFDAYYLDSAAVTLLNPTSTTDINANSKLIQLYPNPASTGITLKFTEQAASASFSIAVYNQQSQLISKQDFSKPSGEFVKTVPISSLPKGNYIIVVLKNGKQYATKEFVKQ
jgi:hypothetical protein